MILDTLCRTHFLRHGTKEQRIGVFTHWERAVPPSKVTITKNAAAVPRISGHEICPRCKRVLIGWYPWVSDGSLRKGVA